LKRKTKTTKPSSAPHLDWYEFESAMSYYCTNTSTQRISELYTRVYIKLPKDNQLQFIKDQRATYEWYV